MFNHIKFILLKFITIKYIHLTKSLQKTTIYCLHHLILFPVHTILFRGHILYISTFKQFINLWVADP